MKFRYLPEDDEIKMAPCDYGSHLGTTSGTLLQHVFGLSLVSGLFSPIEKGKKKVTDMGQIGTICYIYICHIVRIFSAAAVAVVVVVVVVVVYMFNETMAVTTR